MISSQVISTVTLIAVLYNFLLVSSADHEETTTEVYEDSTVLTPKSIQLPENPILLASSSNTNVVKLENNKHISSTDEKLGSASTIPIGYATGSGIAYDSPIHGGRYSQLQEPHAHIPQYPTEHHHAVEAYAAGGGNAFHQGHAVTPVHKTPEVIEHTAGLSGQKILGHEGLPQTGYGGVVYAGHGPQAPSKEQVSINKESRVEVGPYGEVYRGDTIHKTINRVEGGLAPHAQLGGLPYSPYGHGGVVYMGNGLIPEPMAGVRTAGPVLPPKGYKQQQHHNFIDQHRHTDHQKPFNTLGLLDPIHFHQSRHHNGFGFQPFGLNRFQPHGAFGFNPFQPQQLHLTQLTINKHFTGGHENHHHQEGPHGHQSLGNKIVMPGLGYNGKENHAIAHTDQAILEGHHAQGIQMRAGEVGLIIPRGAKPDPYYNNEIDPIYRTAHQPNLLTTGPNRYYQGKNPVGVYERYHRV